MDRRRAIMGLPKGKLPSGYEEVKYLITNGRQRIDTGVKILNNSFEIKCDARFRNTNNNQALWGAFRANTGLQYFYVGKYGTEPTFVFRFYGGENASSNITLDTNKHNFRFVIKRPVSTSDTTVSTLYIDDDSVRAKYNIRLDAIPLQENITLFANGTLYGAWVEGYDWQILLNDELVRDFVSCINSSNIAGLYDLVNNVFYPSQGVGNFGYEKMDGTIVNPT